MKLHGRNSHAALSRSRQSAFSVAACCRLGVPSSVRCQSLQDSKAEAGPLPSPTNNIVTSSSSSARQPVSQIEGLHRVPIALTMQPSLYSYLLDHTREHVALAALRAETAGIHGSHMQITPEQGTLLALLAEMSGTKRAVEVGVFTGYSALSVALVLPEDGILWALDKDPRTMAIANKYFELAGVSHKVQAMVAPALDSLRQLLQKYGPNSFDFAFLDADKRMYDQYYELLLLLVRPGGLIAVDNVLFHGKVADPAATDKATLALRSFNEKVLSDPRVTLSLIPVGDGLALCRVRG